MSGGILKRGDIETGGYCPGGFCPGGILSGGILSGGYCPGGYCPDTRENIPKNFPFIIFRQSFNRTYDFIFWPLSFINKLAAINRYLRRI